MLLLLVCGATPPPPLQRPEGLAWPIYYPDYDMLLSGEGFGVIRALGLG
jgi:hypothetical protein